MNRFKLLRKKTGLSQKEFAWRFDIPLRTYQDWEYDVKQPSEYVANFLEVVVNKYLEEGKPVKKYYMYVIKGESDLQSAGSGAFLTARSAAEEATDRGYTNEEVEICEITEDGDVIVTDIISLSDALELDE